MHISWDLNTQIDQLNCAFFVHYIECRHCMLKSKVMRNCTLLPGYLVYVPSFLYIAFYHVPPRCITNNYKKKGKKRRRRNEIKRRHWTIAYCKLTKMQYLWKRQRKDTKLRIIRDCVFSTAISGCATLTKEKINEGRLNSFELKCYHRLSKFYGKTNSQIKEIRNHTKRLMKYFKTRKLKCFGHLKRYYNLENIF